MKQLSRFLILLLTVCVISPLNAEAKGKLIFSADDGNDLYRLLVSEGCNPLRFDTADEAIAAAGKGDAVIITAQGYPEKPVTVSETLIDAAKRKNLKIYAEYVGGYPGVKIDSTAFAGTVERAVITSDFFRPTLDRMDLLGINGCHIYRADVKNPLMCYARLAGYDTARYGLTDTDVYPLLWRSGDTMLAFSCLSCFETARYAPVASWQAVWTSIIRWLTGDKKFTFKNWSSDPRPTYGRNDEISASARRDAVGRSAEWLYNARLLIHPAWRDSVYLYQGDGLNPYGPAMPHDALIGDGAHGVLEGHASSIEADGSQRYRYWLRADVQGEVAYLLASAAAMTGNKKYAATSERLLDYVFHGDDFINGKKKDPKSDAYGLIGWAKTHDYVYYNDDNARLLLGAIGASALLGNERWNKQIVECILANFMLSSRQGFLPDRFEEPDLLANGRSYYADRDFILAHPHFDSWMLACYLWLYDKTGYQPLLDKARTAISLIMEAYPDNWSWTNGIQQERARMILPLAWLVRVEDTPEHRQWLDTVVNKLLENQAPCGGIREELGDSRLGLFGKTQSNKDYGVTEAPLISENGDPVADMLYTSNFAFFALNEAAHATGNPKYRDAVGRLADFLVRVQVKSDRHPDIDGAWMRAFDYDRWDYWASNADSGWGAWSTLTGWIQTWITVTEALVENNSSFWDTTRDADVKPQMKAAEWMLKR